MIEINESSNGIEITVPVKKFYSHSFMFGVVTLFLIPVSIIALIFGLSTLNFIKILESLCGLIMGFYFGNFTLWLLYGKEKVIIQDKFLEYSKTNGILTFKKAYLLDSIEDIYVAEKRFASDSWMDRKREKIREKQKAFPFWYKMGRIVLVYQNKEITILNGLEDDEAIEIGNLLKERQEHLLKML